MDAFVNQIGFTAGIMLWASLVPQIWRTHKRKSAEDLSFVWQGTAATGHCMQLMYLYHYSIWAVFYPMAGQLMLILYLAGIKLYYEQRHLLGMARGGGDRQTTPAFSDDDESIDSAGGGGFGSEEAASRDNDDNNSVGTSGRDESGDVVHSASQGVDEVESGRPSATVEGPSPTH